MLCALVKAQGNFAGDFIKFQTITLVPYEPKLIKHSMLTQQQKNWLNDYHQTIRDKILSRVEDIRTKSWIERKISMPI